MGRKSSLKFKQGIGKVQSQVIAESIESGGKDQGFIFKVQWIVISSLDGIKGRNNESFPGF